MEAERAFTKENPDCHHGGRVHVLADRGFPVERLPFVPVGYVRGVNLRIKRRSRLSAFAAAAWTPVPCQRQVRDRSFMSVLFRQRLHRSIGYVR